MRKIIKTVRTTINWMFLKLGLAKVNLPPRIEEIDYSIHIAAQIISKFKQYIPHSSSAIDFKSLSIILNDICINKRKSIIELGSGFSTIAIAKLIELNGLKCDFISVEHDREWLNYVNELLLNEGLESYIKIKHVPLENEWYNLDLINELVIGSNLIDSLIIDGPPANIKIHKYARRPALLKLKDFLSPNCFIFLHDTDRSAENRIVINWEKLYHIQFKKLGKASYCIKGQAFNVA